MLKSVTLTLRALVLLIAATSVATPAAAASKEKIQRKTAEKMAIFKEDISGAETLLNKAAGVLVFPSIKKAGIGVGGEYGQCVLLVKGQPVAYYSSASASIGFQLGAQARTQILVFLDQGALDKFRASDGWEIGVDGSVAVVTVGVGGTIDTDSINQPIVAFVMGNKGLMYNLSLEGSKISQIKRD